MAKYHIHEIGLITLAVMFSLIFAAVYIVSTTQAWWLLAIAATLLVVSDVILHLKR